MKSIIIVSKCIRIEKKPFGEDLYHFHFKGVYSGEALKKVVLTKAVESSIQKDEEYLMYVQLLSCLNGVLKGRILKIKPLDECWDKA
jgi:hypothetical protein